MPIGEGLEEGSQFHIAGGALINFTGRGQERRLSLPESAPQVVRCRRVSRVVLPQLANDFSGVREASRFVGADPLGPEDTPGSKDTASFRAPISSQVSSQMPDAPPCHDEPHATGRAIIQDSRGRILNEF